MSKFGNIRLPPLSAAMNVAWQTLKQNMPEKAGGTRTQPSETTHFAQSSLNHTGDAEHHELSNMNTKSTNPFLNSQPQDDGYGQGYQTTALVGGSGSRQHSLGSVDMSEDDFVEGRSEVKINEYQAAWNVTNAIQVLNCCISVELRFGKNYFQIKYAF